MKARNPQIPYTREELFAPGAPRVYTGRELDEIAFPLGGIGTGMISLGGWGQLRDFETFNRPHKGLGFNYTFFTLFAQRAGEAAVTRVVQGPVGGAGFTGVGSGVDRMNGAGLPHLRSVRFEGAFPFARLAFEDPAMPLAVSMEAFNPFIPLKPDDSALPVAMFRFDLHNRGDAPVRAVLFANLENKTGFPETGGGAIEYFEGDGVRGLKMSTGRHAPDSPRYGTLALATPHKDLNVQTHWRRAGWFDTLQSFWDQASGGELTENREPARAEDGTDVGSIGLRVTIEPGASASLPIWIAWHNPNFEQYWSGESPKPIWKNHYATLHADAVAVAQYMAQHQERLESETRAFADALFSSTLPASVLDAVSSQISILKSTTCLRLEDGTFYGWEGCNPGAGCCHGTCTHVWNYAQALPYLFPSLERSVREADYRINLREDGHMTFRMPLPLGTLPAEPLYHAAADGQLGGVMKVYREWRLCGDDRWLRALWPSVKRALAYAWVQWDKDRDGVMEGVQHNTYDIEFHGPNSMLGGFYLGALRAAEEMARRLGEDGQADEYRALFESGRAWMDQHLFNGDYYVQQVRPDGGAPTELDPRDPVFPVYQYGAGCLSDQMIGQWYARMLRLGDLFDASQVKRTMQAIFKHNWRGDLSEHANVQRVYALNDEAGLVVTTWPHGGRPAFPFPYSDEVWCGMEYQVAAHMIYEGMVEEGLAIVKGARDRHTGLRRNPWNEFECGSHYARSMASYSLLTALCDFDYSAPGRSLGFAPRVHAEDFACFFCVPSGWGMLRQRLRDGERCAAVEVRAGELTLRELHVPFEASGGRASLAARVLKADMARCEEGTRLTFAEPATISAGQALVVDAWS